MKTGRSLVFTQEGARTVSDIRAGVIYDIYDVGGPLFFMDDTREARCRFRGSESIDVSKGSARYAASAETPNAADLVNQPSHYSRFVIEPMTFAMANGLNGLELNAVKYVCRAPYKHDDPEQDYRKAIRCIEMLIEVANRRKRIEGGESPAEVWKEIL